MNTFSKACLLLAALGFARVIWLMNYEEDVRHIMCKEDKVYWRDWVWTPLSHEGILGLPRPMHPGTGEVDFRDFRGARKKEGLYETS